jgi:hypothetical protein
MVQTLATYTDQQYLLEHLISILAFLVNSNGEVLHAYVTLLREFDAMNVIKEVERAGPFNEEVTIEIENLKSLLSRTSRLWDLNLSIIDKSLTN